MKTMQFLFVFLLINLITTMQVNATTLSSATADVGSAPHFLMTSLAKAVEKKSWQICRFRRARP